MPSISFLDSTGFATLTNGKAVPRVNAWTPKRVPVGPRATGLGTGRIHLFEFRTDDLVSFSLDNIPGTDANMQIMLRLQGHLLRGGLVTLSAGRTAYADHWGTCSLAPDTEPEIEFSDRDALEYSFVVTLRTSGPAAADFLPPLLPELKLWWLGDTLNGVVDDGALVSVWPDISGENNHGTQSNNSRYPTFRETAANGHGAVEFGGEDFLISPAVMQPTVGTTLFSVIKRFGTYVSHGAFYSFAQSTQGDEGASVLEQTDGEINYFEGNGGYITIGTDVSTSWNIVTLDFQTPSSCIPYLNGVAGAAFNPNNVIEGSNLTHFVAGAVNGSGIWYGAAAQEAEHLWYGANFGDADLALVHGYLASRYGITLP